MKNHMMERINSDRGDSLTISQILWIVFVVLLVMIVGNKIFAAVSRKGTDVANCIDNSDQVIVGGNSGGTSTGNDGYGSLSDCSKNGMKG